jgi:hypothetical protein
MNTQGKTVTGESSNQNTSEQTKSIQTPKVVKRGGVPIVPSMTSGQTDSLLEELKRRNMELLNEIHELRKMNELLKYKLGGMNVRLDSVAGGLNPTNEPGGKMNVKFLNDQDTVAGNFIEELNRLPSLNDSLDNTKSSLSRGVSPVLNDMSHIQQNIRPESVDLQVTCTTST